MPVSTISSIASADLKGEDIKNIATYTFRVELLGTKDPVVSRTFTLPAYSTFQRLHHAIQYTFGWENNPSHEFRFQIKRGTHSKIMTFEFTRLYLRIGTNKYNERHFEDEQDTRLDDVWKDDGELKKKATKSGRYLPLFYVYDFGDQWEHKVELISKGKSAYDTLNVMEAIGCSPPIQDAHEKRRDGGEGGEGSECAILSIEEGVE